LARLPLTPIYPEPPWESADPRPPGHSALAPQTCEGSCCHSIRWDAAVCCVRRNSILCKRWFGTQPRDFMTFQTTRSTLRILRLVQRMLLVETLDNGGYNPCFRGPTRTNRYKIPRTSAAFTAVHVATLLFKRNNRPVSGRATRRTMITRDVWILTCLIAVWRIHRHQSCTAVSVCAPRSPTPTAPSGRTTARLPLPTPRLAGISSKYLAPPIAKTPLFASLCPSCFSSGSSYSVAASTRPRVPTHEDTSSALSFAGRHPGTNKPCRKIWIASYDAIANAAKHRPGFEGGRSRATVWFWDAIALPARTPYTHRSWITAVPVVVSVALLLPTLRIHRRNFHPQTWIGRLKPVWNWSNGPWWSYAPGGTGIDRRSTSPVTMPTRRSRKRHRTMTCVPFVSTPLPTPIVWVTCSANTSFTSTASSRGFNIRITVPCARRMISPLLPKHRVAVPIWNGHRRKFEFKHGVGCTASSAFGLVVLACAMFAAEDCPSFCSSSQF
jgi:hypothetical protein